jgi:hypothetical protein
VRAGDRHLNFYETRDNLYLRGRTPGLNVGVAHAGDGRAVVPGT